MGRNDPFLGSWTWEIIFIVGSALCLAVQISLLAAYDGKPIFTWHGITLKSVVSVLSTTGKASLLFAIEETGQPVEMDSLYRSRTAADGLRAHRLCQSGSPWEPSAYVALQESVSISISF